MKHTVKVTLLLLALFLASQLFGLFVISYDMKKSVSPETNQTTVSFSETAIGERPDIHGPGTIIYLSVAILVGTMLILLLAKYGKKRLWKAWFFLAIWMTISITLGVFMPVSIAYLIGLILATVKIYRPNFYSHNLTEVLIYSGIAFLLVPLLNVFWAVMLLLLISVYDAYAVWYSKHMVKLAVFQRDSKLFAGLNINYNRKDDEIPKPSKTTKGKTVKKESGYSAVLGGGDIAFPLIFSGTIIVSIFNSGFTKTLSYALTVPVTILTTISLGTLLLYGKKDRFYPAMPFITAGCLAGFLITKTILYFI
ncbi:hypothetical protein GOV05_05345 [Candidatus Woesearchaeota archaeon]|nr:hypothetical protein [Candidatus Woesearchaeota archaeon]